MLHGKERERKYDHENIIIGGGLSPHDQQDLNFKSKKGGLL
jgi:hypothetical protein